jgi:hypothetical protein
MNNPIQKSSIYLIGILLITSCQSHSKITKVKVAQECIQSSTKHFDVLEKQKMAIHHKNQDPTGHELMNTQESTGKTIQISSSKGKSRTSFLDILKQVNGNETPL